MDHIGFPDIQGLHNVVRFAEAFPALIQAPVQYRSKVKLHGMNAAVRIEARQVGAQSRTQMLTPEADLAGFARWVDGSREYWAKEGVSLTVFGEWCGPGVVTGRGTAISRIPDKIFAIFAVRMADTLIDEPSTIALMFGELPERAFILPWHGESLAIDYRDAANVAEAAAACNKSLAEIEPCDPWVLETFGTKGESEGLVYYPQLGRRVTDFENLAFKVKAEKHRVQIQKAGAQVDPAVAAGADEFVKMFVTGPRLEQGLETLGGKADIKEIVRFIGWVEADVAKESFAELAASGLQWPQVRSKVVQAARNWFVAKTKS